MKLIELRIEDLNEEYVDAISLVEHPAIEENLMAFDSEKKFIFAKTNSEKRIITGPAMLPTRKIYRVDQFTGEEYEVFFSEETIEKIAIDYMKKQRIFNTTIDHERSIQNVFIFESWIINDNNVDKAKHLGYDLPNGTWMVSMKVDDEKIWEKIKNGSVKGFSVEGYFYDKLIKNEKILSDNEKINYIKNIINSKDSDDEKESKIKNIINKL